MDRAVNIKNSKLIETKMKSIQREGETTREKREKNNHHPIEGREQRKKERKKENRNNTYLSSILTQTK